MNKIQRAYLSDNMNKVSRSFALLVPAVETPLCDYLATAYLICRVVDNIEDCTQSFSWKQARFAEFAALLDKPRKAPNILLLWEQETWPGLSRDEQLMMSVAGGLTLWQIYALIPQVYRISITKWAMVMAQGMEQVSAPTPSGLFVSRNGVQLPPKEKEYNQYCFFVAGTVGHMITEMAINHYEFDGEIAKRLLANCEASGRALQKTNIVKDFARDLDRGACYLPDDWLAEVNYTPLELTGAPRKWTEKVLGNVVHEFEDSVTFVLDLPLSAAGFREASLLMLLPGYETLLLIARNRQRLFTPSHNFKISRIVMAKCLSHAKRMVNDNDAILAYSRTIDKKLKIALYPGKTKITAS
ncbi:MAG: squalene/phytoene synthase family protein [Candidatus Promineifilaceae bacterium]|nr:squalene/phytoene synthase family protein [Candidatus Promineifilaceae bacterium]